jgi:hypothetical protein
LIGILIFTLAGRYPEMEDKSRKSGQKADVSSLKDKATSDASLI